MKRRLKSIRLDKIAAVDAPCQEHATVAIIKRAPALPDGVPRIAKKTFQEALNAQLVSEKISDTFWRAFENQWAVRDAFRTALTDEISEGNDGTAAIDGFTAAMQQIATLAASAARDAASTADTDLESAVEDAVSKWLQQQEQIMTITTKAQLKTAVASFDIAKSTFADATSIIDAAVELDAIDELPADSELAKAAADKKKKAKEGDKDFMALKREITVLKMAPAARTYFDALPEGDQDAFIAKSADDQAAEIAKANEADPVIYKTSTGVEIRKSDGQTAVMMAKQLDAQAKQIDDLSKSNTQSSLETRAAGYTNVAKSQALDMLKSVEAVGADTETGKSILKTLDTMNKSRSSLFKSLGSTEAPEGGDINKARVDFKSKVSEIAKRDEIGPADAMAKARTEHPDLFAEAYPGREEEADA